MRSLMTMLIACVATIGIASASTQEPTPAVAPTTETPTPPEEGVLDESTGYECKYSPYCRKASQCEAYCAGGAPVCSRGCCACAS
jgi:hypothetical protein